MKRFDFMYLKVDRDVLRDQLSCGLQKHEWCLLVGGGDLFLILSFVF